MPDFPKPGILFYDITTLLKDPDAYRQAIDLMLAPYRNEKIDLVVGMESRGFIFGAPIARDLGIGFVPVRKKGKLPGTTIRQEYDLEYGTDTVEIHSDAVAKGDNLLIVDDLIGLAGIASGGSPAPAPAATPSTGTAIA